MENKIKALFYHFNEKKIKETTDELVHIGYSLHYNIVENLGKLKSEIMTFSWDFLVFNYENNDPILKEILEFINDLESKTIVIVTSDLINSDLIQTVYRSSKNDVVPKSGSHHICLALIRNFEQTKPTKDYDFTKKELFRSRKSQNEYDHFLNQIIESTTNPIFYKEIGGRYLGCNTAFANFIGLPKEKILGKTVFEVSPKELAQKYFEMDQEFFKNPETQHYEYHMEHSDGHVMDVVFYKTAIRDEEGNIVGLLGHMFDITELKNLEKEVQRGKDMAELILDSIGEMYVLLDLNGNISGINKKACQVLQIEKNKAIGKNWIDQFIPNNEKEQVRDVFEKTINKQFNLEDKIEGKIIALNQEIKRILWANSLIQIENGEIIGVLSLGTDITHKDKVELELERSERKYKTLVANMQEGLGIVDLNENVLLTNLAFDQIFGFGEEGMVGKNLQDFIVKDDVNIISKETKKRLTNQISNYKMSIKRKDQSVRTLSISSVPWKNSNEEIIGALSLINDITEQEFVNSKLLRKEQIEQSIIEISSQFITSDNFNEKLDDTLNELKKIIDAERYGILSIQNGKLKLSNEQFSDESNRIGVEFEEISFNHFKYALIMLDSFDFLFIDHIEDLPENAKVEKEVFRKYGIFNFLGIPFYVDSKLHGLIAVSNIYDIDAWTVEDLSILRTISEIVGLAFSRRNAEEKVKQLNQDLITKNNELEQVVYVTSHDIRSPVVNIMGFSDEMIKALNKLSDKIFDPANQIQNRDQIEFLLEKDIPQIQNFIRVSGEKIDKLLFALLKLSRMGRAAINKVDVNMNELIQQVINNFEFIAKEQNIKFKIGNLSSCFTDEVAINQVFSNLIDNSIKYRDPAKETLIEITAKETDEQVTYCISDNGIGISEKEMDKIFDVFYRIDPENQKGEGIGLSLIKKIMERVDGKISLGSKEGVGTKFYIILEKQSD